MRLAPLSYVTVGRPGPGRFVLGPRNSSSARTVPERPSLAKLPFDPGRATRPAAPCLFNVALHQPSKRNWSSAVPGQALRAASPYPAWGPLSRLRSHPLCGYQDLKWAHRLSQTPLLFPTAESRTSSHHLFPKPPESASSATSMPDQHKHQKSSPSIYPAPIAKAITCSLPPGTPTADSSTASRHRFPKPSKSATSAPWIFSPIRLG